MTSSNSPSKAPSLLADSQSSDTLDAPPRHHVIEPRKNLKKPLLILGGIIALTLVARLTWNLDLFIEPAGEPVTPYSAGNAALAPDTLDNPPVLEAELAQIAPSDSAQIISEPIAQQRMDPPYAPIITSVPVKIAPPQQATPPVKVTPSRPSTRATSAPRTSDIDVLIALMHYIESPDNDLPQSTRKALHDRIRACPRANTEAGIQCRQRICSELPDSLELCPAP